MGRMSFSPSETPTGGGVSPTGGSANNAAAVEAAALLRNATDKITSKLTDTNLIARFQLAIGSIDRKTANSLATTISVQDNPTKSCEAVVKVCSFGAQSSTYASQLAIVLLHFNDVQVDLFLPKVTASKNENELRLVLSELEAIGNIIKETTVKFLKSDVEPKSFTEFQKRLFNVLLGLNEGGIANINQLLFQRATFADADGLLAVCEKAIEEGGAKFLEEILRGMLAHGATGSAEDMKAQIVFAESMIGMFGKNGQMAKSKVKAPDSLLRSSS